jgi:hypothetical protein
LIQVKPEYVKAELKHQSQPDQVMSVDTTAIASTQDEGNAFAKAGLRQAVSMRGRISTRH